MILGKVEGENSRSSLLSLICDDLELASCNLNMCGSINLDSAKLVHKKLQRTAYSG